MHLGCLERLRCPFCGVVLTVHPTAHTVQRGDELHTGILRCRCCAYPVVDGIPVLRPDDFVADACRRVEAGDATGALLALLNLSGARATQFLDQRASDTATYQALLHLLSPDLEGTYFLYRFSDPTFLVSEAVVRALAGVDAIAGGPLLDMCGGSGHLARTLSHAAPQAGTWLADLEYWKVWLAHTFVAPGVHAVCCDANHPLPFAPETFSLVLCSGAFEYVWPRRSFAGEMWRLAGGHGVVAITHTHNVLCENPSQGMPLSAAEYRALFEQTQARIYGEGALLNAVLSGAPLDFSTAPEDAALDDEAAFVVVASGRRDVFRRHDVRPVDPERALSPRLELNPLYAPVAGVAGRYRLTYPSPYYEEEFAECRRYLPDEITWHGLAATTGHDRLALLERRVLLDVPERYLSARQPSAT